jgi:3-deoxy-D-manno-octulosonic acid kinase
LLSCGEALFDPKFWAARGAANPASAGRGAAWFVRWREHRWVLRHSRRGGLLAPLTRDRYVWMSETRVRTFAEWRLLHTLVARGLPVPKPVVACYQRAGFVYRCSLITERIRHARPLSTELAARVLPPEVWSEAGAVIARLHRAGVDHADLNAHNVLCGYGVANGGSISVIDFDRGRLRTPGEWQQGNLARLRRSLEKISSSLPPGRFSPREWAWLESGYGAA